MYVSASENTVGGINSELLVCFCPLAIAMFHMVKGSLIDGATIFFVGEHLHTVVYRSARLYYSFRSPVSHHVITDASIPIDAAKTKKGYVCNQTGIMWTLIVFNIRFITYCNTNEGGDNHIPMELTLASSGIF
ncbi:unnamed protein product [Lactuca saligna]|uniref:Uncharacterized protein n=1 Tax=Lactuca saligna TaxID=75948 RepID=A0AA36E4X6_LACSI|nr:unnamed protein product [Lactuca saligna]